MFLRVFGVLTERDIADRLRRVERMAERGKLFGERDGETKNEGTSFMAEERKNEESVGNEEKSVNLQGESGSGPKYRGWEKRSTEINTSDYEPTDEFRELQESSRSRGEEAIRASWTAEHLDSDTGLRLEGIFQQQMESSSSANGRSDGILGVEGQPDTQFTIRKNVSGKLFHDIFEIARGYLPNGELVDLHDGYDDCVCYLSDDGTSGFAIERETGNLVSVFNLGLRRKFLRSISDYIKDEGATHLDAYASKNQNLREIYSKTLGAKVASSMDYNMEYDHDGIAERHGNPDVVFMLIPEKGKDISVEERHFGKDEYDDAAAYANSFNAERSENSGTSKENAGNSQFSAEEREAVDELRSNGVEVITDTAETERVLDEMRDNGETRFLVAGERGAETIDRDDGYSWLNNLFTAEYMEEKGETPIQIKMATGWERGADGLWRREIGDFSIKWDSLVGKGINSSDEYYQTTRPLKSILGAYSPELFRLYPQLEGVRVRIIYPSWRNTQFGSYNKNDNTITINGFLTEPRDEQNETEEHYKARQETTRGVLLHEVQHAIQDIEGFASGGNSGARIYTGDQEKIKKWNEEVERMSERIKEIDDETTNAYNNGGLDAFIEVIKKIDREWHDLLQKRAELKEKIENEKIKTVSVYNNLAGEVEARNVERRTGTNKAQTLLEETEDVARKDQIFLRNGIYYDINGEELKGNRVALQTSDGEMYGFVKDGKVYLGPNAGSIPASEWSRMVDTVMQEREKSSGETKFSAEERNEEGTRESAEERVNGNSGHEMTEAEQLERDNERYNSDLDAFSRGEGYSPVRVGAPSAVLRACGLNDTEMYIKRKVLRDHLNKHNLTIDDIRNLPKALQKPLLVYEWGNEAKSMVIITNMEHGDDRITVAVKVERGGEIVEVNEIASVHAKEASRFLSEMTNARRGGLREALRWVGDKEKALEWLGLTPSSPEEVGALTEQELSVAKVIQDFDNPTLPSEKSDTSKENAGNSTKYSAEERESMTPKQIDDEYFRAMEAGDEATMREMLDEAARRNGYDKDNGWRSYHTAPSRGEAAEDGTLYTWTLKDVADGGQVANDISDSYPTSADINGSRNESMNAIQDALSAIRRGEDPTVTIYRAVPKDIEEGRVRNGDWVTMSRAYAEEHGRSNIDGDYRIIEEQVPASQLYWDGNDINEWGFDDGREYRYGNTENNRKLDDLVTRDDDGKVIPPSKRFDSRNADTRFSAEEREIIDKARKDGTYGMAPNGKQSNLYNKYGEHVWAMVRTPQFKNWFGDWEKEGGDSSKVVDENGEPLVVYHGSRTGGEFSMFDGTTFFTDNEDVAEVFRDDAPYYVKVNGRERILRNGWDVRNVADYISGYDYTPEELFGNGTMRVKEDWNWDNLEESEKEDIRYLLGMDEDEDLETLRIEAAQPTFETFLNIRNPYIMDFGGNGWMPDENNPESNFDKAKEGGHDGMIVRNIVEGGPSAMLLNGDDVPPATDYVTFSPNQIKSVDNNGDFSTENNDIRFSAEGRELSDADTRETVSDIENPENDTRFSATERVATADEARERMEKSEKR